MFDFTQLQVRRALTEAEVLTINCIIKKRAYRFTAAGREDWLHRSVASGSTGAPSETAASKMPSTMCNDRGLAVSGATPAVTAAWTN